GAFDGHHGVDWATVSPMTPGKSLLVIGPVYYSARAAGEQPAPHPKFCRSTTIAVGDRQNFGSRRVGR
ncbi:MAG: hypothetical protein AAGK32_04715, partial [Actinomycetota bacterium]